jgi:CDK-activating kinase assembly factor MAT1
MTFIPQTFEDLVVEKEVAIRRKLAKESVAQCLWSISATCSPLFGIRFNKRREDFPDLRSYNDYLQEVEDISKSHLILPLSHLMFFTNNDNNKNAYHFRVCTKAFNLINEIDIPETQARIVAYRKENAAFIELNQQREEAYAQALKEHEEAERRERQLRAEELRRAEEEERDAREGERRALIDNLENSDADAGRLVAQARAEALKRAAARTAAAQQAVFAQQQEAMRLRAAQNAAVVPDQPHVPLSDTYYAYEDMYVLRNSYFDPASDAVRRDKEGIMRAGGYRAEEAWERALRYAVAGLDISPPLGDVSLQEMNTSRVDADVIMASV